MNAATLTLKNLTRNPRRTILTIAAIALPLLVFSVAHAAVNLVDAFLLELTKNQRVVVHDKVTFTTFLPQRMRDQILDIAPSGAIRAVCGVAWFGGRLENSQSTFPSMGVDRDTFAEVYSDYDITPEQLQRFKEERRAALIGAELAKQFNWQEGDRFVLVGGLPPYLKMEFVVAGVVPNFNGPWVYFGLDYYNEAMEKETGSPIGVNNFWLKCNSEAARQWALTEIDKHFENSEHETQTEDESTFFAGFTRMGGDWVQLVWTVGQFIVVVALMAAFNTMSMAFRERTRELAIMRALGFPAGRIVGMVLAEGLLLGLMGGVIAVVPLYLALRVWSPTIPGLPGTVRITEHTMLLAIGVALGIGLISALVPAVMAGRLQVATALRRVA
jgi:putative ABC transport system permease protein